LEGCSTGIVPAEPHFFKPYRSGGHPLLRSSSLYGITDGSGQKATISLTDIGAGIVAPTSSSQRRESLREAFGKVDDFKRVLDHYGDKKIPEGEYFSNFLVKEFDISRERVTDFIRIFSENLRYLGSFGVTPQESKSEENDNQSEPKQDASSGSREFLETCFVLMPFGDWFDRYYEALFKPAIKAAELEPVRADNLFSTGSVMEQIWEEIGKAKVLLAELTGKNANVFYELGLSHASRKPVVFVTSNLNDVPFDLRHLRIVQYDQNDPFWGEKLKRSLTQYLKNAKSDPDKSIPQPFRNYRTDSETDS
jgi:hypothetical protein